MSGASAQLIGILQDVLSGIQTPVPLHEPYFNGNEWAYVKECIDTRWVSSVGSYVDLFEEKLAEHCGVKHAVVTVNGTQALYVACLLAGVEPDDEVLMPSLTFIATANAVSYCGAAPHFVEADEATLGIDIPKLDVYLTSITERRDDGLYNTNTGNRIAAIIPVHVFGHMCDMDALTALADKYYLPIIEDAAEALGSTYKNRPAGSFGQCGALSFNGNKIVTTGGGGAIVTNDAELAKRAKHITTTAKQPHKWAFIHDEIGFNFRMPNINAALGCAQLEQLDGFVKAKRDLAARYKKAFAGSDFEFFIEPEHVHSNYWLNLIKLGDSADRDAMLDALHGAGYLCRPVWQSMHTLPMYKDCPRMDLSVTEDLEQRIINIPSSVTLGL